MSWEVAAGQVWEAKDETTRVKVIDETLTKPTARYDLPVVIDVEVVTGRHSAIKQQDDQTTINRDTLLREFSQIQ